MAEWLAWIFIGIELVLMILLIRIIVMMGFFAFGLKQTLPFVPTTRGISKAIVRSNVLAGRRRIVDLGSGAGDLLFVLARAYPETEFVGVEKNRWLVGLARLRNRFRRQGVAFVTGDMFDFPIADADAVVGFWITDLTPRITEKIAAESPPGTVVVSHLFPLPEHPGLVFDQRLPTKRSKIFVYRKRR
jgi:SAM-dependent methyltransferase